MHLSFDAVSHVYLMDGETVPGTTAILRAAELMGDLDRIPEMYRDRGKYVHEWTAADDEGRVSKVTTVPDLVAPYLDAWRAFLASEPTLKIRGIEELAGNPTLRYATHVDRRVTWHGRTVIINIKCGRPYPYHGPQLALEAMCFGEAGSVRRAGVYLDGKTRTFRVKTYDDVSDFAIARGAVDAYYALRK